MKKIISSLLILVLLTGCKEDYKLTINPNSITEEINFTLKNDETEKAILINELFRVTNINYEERGVMGEYIIDRLRNDNLTPSDSIDEFYTKNRKDDNINLSYTYKENLYNYSNIFNSCFGDTYFESTEKYYVINGYNQFKCLVKDKVKIVVETDYRVIESNADKVIGNRYIWNFTKDNNLEKELYIQVSKKYPQKKKNYLPVILTIGIIILIVILNRKKIKFNFKSNNEV